MPALLLIVLILVAAAGPALADPPESCMDDDVEGVIAHVNHLTTSLKIAIFRADIPAMKEAVYGKHQELPNDVSGLKGFLSTCEEEANGRIGRVCGYDCHLQLGRYHLFMASDLPYLTTASPFATSSQPLSPDNLFEHTEAGATVIERGLSLIGRQQNASTEGNQWFRNYYRQLTALSNLRARLIMTGGDIWYQTVSDARVQRLDFLVDETLGDPGDAAAADPNLGRALDAYERAMWALIEAKTDIPSDSTYDDLRAEVLVLERELITRLDSVNAGLLFLGIDPEEFMTHTFEELKDEMVKLKDRLTGIEGKIEAVIENWINKRGTNAARQIDERRVVRSQKANLAAHRIAKLETAAQIASVEIHDQVLAVQEKRDDFAYREGVRKLEIALERTIAELRYKQEQLKLRREGDLLSIGREAAMERRNELRWLLSFEITRMNLELQVQSLEAQFEEYRRQISRNDERIAEIAGQISQRELSIQNAELSIENHQAALATLAERREAIFLAQRAVTRESICGIESQLRLIGDVADRPFTGNQGESACALPDPAHTRREFQRAMCGDDQAQGLRGRLSEQRIYARAFLLKCVLAPDGNFDLSGLEDYQTVDDRIVRIDGYEDAPEVDCAGFDTTEMELAEKIWEAELAQAQGRKSNIEAQIERLKMQVVALGVHFTRLRTTHIMNIAAIQGAETVYAIMAAIPELTTTVFGPQAKTDLAKPFKAFLDAAKFAYQSQIKIAELDGEQQRAITALAEQISQLEGRLEELDLDQTVRSLALHQAHFQLAGRVQGARHELQELMLMDAIGDFECREQGRSIEQEVAVLKAEHARLMASLDLESRENDLIEYQIAIKENEIAQLRNDIAIQESAIAGLELQRDQLKEDNDIVVDLMASVRNRQAYVKTVSNRVDQLADESVEQASLIQELNERRANNMLAIADKEFDYLEIRIKGEDSHTDELIRLLGSAHDIARQDSDLQHRLSDIQNETTTAIANEQEALTELLSDIDEGTEKHALFLLGEQELSQLLQGLPDFLAAKKGLLRYTNRLLYLLQRRYETIAGLAGGVPSAGTTPLYVRSGNHLSRILEGIIEPEFLDDRQVDIRIAEISIPSYSAFARSIAREGSVRFEISPFAGETESMEDYGYLSLWDAESFLNQKNLTLVDVLVLIQPLIWDTGRELYYRLEHKGSGIVFRRASQGSTEVLPSLKIGGPRVYGGTFYHPVSHVEDLSLIRRYWRAQFLVRNFPEPPGPVNNPDAAFRFLGAPLIGDYELRVKGSPLTLRDTLFTLFLVYATEED